MEKYVASVQTSTVTSETTPIPPEGKVTMAEIKRDLDSLVGLVSVKKQLMQIAQTLKAMEEHSTRHGIKEPLSLYFIIEGKQGSGKMRIAAIISKILSLYGIDGVPLTIHNQALNDYRATHEVFEDCVPHKKHPVYLDDVSRLLAPGELQELSPLRNYWFRFQEQFCQNTMIIGIQPSKREKLIRALEIEHEMTFFIEIPPYEPEDFLRFARTCAHKQRFKIDKDAIPQFLAIVQEHQESPGFRNMLTIQGIVSRAILQSLADQAQPKGTGRKFAFLKPQHFTPINKARIINTTSDPLHELNGLIGLREVKTRVRELMAYVSLQQQRQKAGLAAQPVCTHMAFSGPPGTGKTTVARVIGGLLMQIGVLEKGHFIEAAREDLVGRYIGHTAAKTAELVERAQGGVLFIDECYTLNGSGRDYGQEAVATLVKKMEDTRSNFTVIFGGYGDEMREFISMNPGLKSRIQFHIEFKDYSPGELLDIFRKLCQDEQYELSDQAEKELRSLLQTLYDRRDYSFANGRLVRSLFERSKLSLATRTWHNAKNSSISLITSDDILSVQDYSDIHKILTCTSARREIGFHTTSA